MLSEIGAAMTHAFAGQHEQPISAWTCAKPYFPVSPAVVEYLVSDQRDIAIVAAPFSCLLVTVQHPKPRETVLKSLSVLEQLCSAKWTAGHKGNNWFLLAIVRLPI